MTERKEAVRADQEPGFWCEYRPPMSFVSAEVQKPAHLVNGETLAVAYMRDWRAARSRLALREQDAAASRPLPLQEDGE